jgi:4-hydroxybenzoate polyprenyltransferase
MSVEVRETPATSTRVLFVDLDGTLIASDLLVEMCLQAVKTNPFLLLKIPFWIVRGPAHVKQQLSRHASVDPTLLPYRQEVLEFLQVQKQQGTRLVLATATDQAWARAVADHLGLFDDILASDGVRNLKGREKTAAIQDYCRKSGEEQFGYLGDSRADLAVWEQAQGIYVVHPSPSLLQQVRAIREPTQVFPGQRSFFQGLLQVLRPKQWAKNLIVFLPLLVGPQFRTWKTFTLACLAFLAFCLCASAGYVVNDLVDVSADRSHSRKKQRPFATGQLPLAFGPPLALLFLLGANACAVLCLPLTFALVLGGYFLLGLAYSLLLKRIVLVDVAMLSLLYLSRLWGGALATEIALPSALLAIFALVFTSLAFLKRYADLHPLTADEPTRPDSGSVLKWLGIATGLLGIVGFGLALSLGEVQTPSGQPRFLWLLCPLLLYWLGRLWLTAIRGQLEEDPITFSVSDIRSLGAALLAMTILLFAAVPWF